MIGSKEILIAFRKKIHNIIPAYRDATMDTIDALCTNQNASSVIELSENKHFRRKCSSFSKIIRFFLVSDKEVEDSVSSDSKERDDEGVTHSKEENGGTIHSKEVDNGDVVYSKEAEDTGTPHSTDTEQVKQEFIPDKTLQKEIQKEIAILCSPPEKRNFFYLPAT